MVWFFLNFIVMFFFSFGLVWWPKVYKYMHFVILYAHHHHHQVNNTRGAVLWIFAVKFHSDYLLMLLSCFFYFVVLFSLPHHNIIYFISYALWWLLLNCPFLWFSLTFQFVAQRHFNCFGFFCFCFVFGKFYFYYLQCEAK